MIFEYTRRETSKPIFSLGNVTYRFLPLLEVQILGPNNGYLFSKARLDSGADDTVFPYWMAARIGIDLTDAPEHEAHTVGGNTAIYKYATVSMAITDNREKLIWTATVGFGNTIKRPLLGHAGMMQFFNIEFRGKENKIIIQPNQSFPGTSSFRDYVTK